MYKHLRNILNEIKALGSNTQKLADSIGSIKDGVMTESLVVYELEQRVNTLEGKPKGKHC